MKQPMLIAEIKPRSPFGYESAWSPSVLLELADLHGDMVAAHTSPLWGGSWGWLKEVRDNTDKPLLAKGLHPHDDDIRCAIGSGAQLVLVVGRVAEDELLIPFCVFEPHDLAQLVGWWNEDRIPTTARVLWNQRDLRTGERRGGFDEAARTWTEGWLCQGSFIRSVADVSSYADAVLVGEGLQDYVASLKGK